MFFIQSFLPIKFPKNTEIPCNTSLNFTLLLCKKHVRMTYKSRIERLKSKNVAKNGYWSRRVVDKVDATH